MELHKLLTWILVIILSLSLAIATTEEGSFDEESGECNNCDLSNIQDYDGTITCEPSCRGTNGETITGSITSYGDPTTITDGSYEHNGQMTSGSSISVSSSGQTITVSGGSMVSQDTMASGDFTADTSSGGTTFEITDGSATISTEDSTTFSIEGSDNLITVNPDGSITGIGNPGSTIEHSTNIRNFNTQTSFSCCPLTFGGSEAPPTTDDESYDFDAGDDTTTDYDVDDASVDSDSGITLNEDGTMVMEDGTSATVNDNEVTPIDISYLYSQDGTETTVLGDGITIDSEGNIVYNEGNNPSFSSFDSEGLVTNGVLFPDYLSTITLDDGTTINLGGDMDLVAATTKTSVRLSDNEGSSDIIGMLPYGDEIGDWLANNVVSTSIGAGLDYLHGLVSSDDVRLGGSNSGLFNEGTNTGTRCSYSLLGDYNPVSGEGSGWFNVQSDNWGVGFDYEGQASLGSDEGYSIEGALSAAYRFSESLNVEVEHSYGFETETEGDTTTQGSTLGLNYNNWLLSGEYTTTEVETRGTEERYGGSLSYNFGATPGEGAELGDESGSGLNLGLGFYQVANSETTTSYPELSISGELGILSGDGSIRYLGLDSDDDSFGGNANLYLNLYDGGDSGIRSIDLFAGASYNPSTITSIDNDGDLSDGFGYQYGISGSFMTIDRDFITIPISVRAGIRDNFDDDSSSGINLFDDEQDHFVIISADLLGGAGTGSKKK